MARGGPRPTRDIDLLGYVENEIETLQAVVRDVCLVDVEEDGMRFDAASGLGAIFVASFRRVPRLYGGTRDSWRIP